jgi:hypothetical protein
MWRASLREHRMTDSTLFGVEQLALLALLGVAITLAGVFRHRWLRLRRWFDRQPLEVVGLITLGVAAALGLLLWRMWPATGIAIG